MPRPEGRSPAVDRLTWVGRCGQRGQGWPPRGQVAKAQAKAPGWQEEGHPGSSRPTGSLGLAEPLCTLVSRTGAARPEDAASRDVLGGPADTALQQHDWRLVPVQPTLQHGRPSGPPRDGHRHLSPQLLLDSPPSTSRAKQAGLWPFLPGPTEDGRGGLGGPPASRTPRAGSNRRTAGVMGGGAGSRMLPPSRPPSGGSGSGSRSCAALDGHLRGWPGHLQTLRPQEWGRGFPSALEKQETSGHQRRQGQPAGINPSPPLLPQVNVK